MTRVQPVVLVLAGLASLAALVFFTFRLVPRSAPAPAAATPAPRALVATPPPVTPGKSSSAAASASDEASPLTDAFRSVVAISGIRQFSRTVGAGVVVSPAGHVLTNAHVIEGADEISARFQEAGWFPLHPLRVEMGIDLALLKPLDSRAYRPITIRPTPPAVAESVYAVGSPLSDQLAFSVTRGIVSSLSRKIGGRLFVQHDAALNPGNSGGPLLDSQGRLVGINTWMIEESQGLGFAIPAGECLRFLEESGL
ncbi:MAG: trypsin-like peptidase domain-containing protein [Candidatus Fermentibacter sp.]|nr:trypsin-like peptidase domain-containing protein [Candidatus Fermentibacter sp.]